MLLTSIISKRSPEQLFSSKIFVKSNGGHFSEDKLFMFGCYWQLSQDHLDATFCTESISESSILVHRTIAKISCVVWLMVHYCGYIGGGRGWGAWGLNVIMHTGQAHCVNTQSTSICMHISYLPTSQCSGNKTDTSCNFPHKPTVCNTGTGFVSCTVISLKHFKFGRAAATTSPAPKGLEKGN